MTTKNELRVIHHLSGLFRWAANRTHTFEGTRRRPGCGRGFSGGEFSDFGDPARAFLTVHSQARSCCCTRRTAGSSAHSPGPGDAFPSPRRPAMGPPHRGPRRRPVCLSRRRSLCGFCAIACPCGMRRCRNCPERMAGVARRRPRRRYHEVVGQREELLQE